MVTPPARRTRKPRTPRTPAMPVLTDLADAPAVIAALRAEHGDRPAWCRVCQRWPSLLQTPHWPAANVLLLSQRRHLGRPVAAHCADHGCTVSWDITGALYNRAAGSPEARLQQQTIAVTNLDVAPLVWAATILTAGVAITEPTGRKYRVHGPGRERRAPHDDALFSETGITGAKATADIADQLMWFLHDRDRFRDQTAWAAACEVVNNHDQSHLQHLYFEATHQARAARKSTYEQITAGCATLPEPLRSTVTDTVDHALKAIRFTPPAAS